MAERVVEVRGQNFAGGIPTRQWLFRGFTDILAVDARLQTFAANEIELMWGGLPIDLPGRGISELGGGEFMVTIPYSAKSGNGSIIMPGAGAATSKAPEHGGDNGKNEAVLADISFSVRGGTQHIKQSRETFQSAATDHPTTGPRTARDFGQSIGVDPDKKEVQGVDILVPEVAFTRDVLIPAAAFTGEYARRCEIAVGKLNSAKFFGYEIHEVLCTGITIGKVDGSGYRAGQFEFSVKRNRSTTLTISPDPELVLDDVGGHSYVWTTYELQTTSVGGKNKQTVLPFEVYEERVYDEYDFGLLNLEESRVAP